MKRHVLTPPVVAFVLVALAAPAWAQGTLERIQVRGASLEGNLSGDDPSRSVAVYLPPSYATSPNRRDLDAALTRLGVPHTFEIYEGDHGNRVAARFNAEVMRFFGDTLVFPR